MKMNLSWVDWKRWYWSCLILLGVINVIKGKYDGAAFFSESSLSGLRQLNGCANANRSRSGCAGDKVYERESLTFNGNPGNLKVWAAYAHS